jgi:hypothetical protein
MCSALAAGIRSGADRPQHGSTRLEGALEGRQARGQDHVHLLYLFNRCPPVAGPNLVSPAIPAPRSAPALSCMSRETHMLH